MRLAALLVCFALFVGAVSAVATDKIDDASTTNPLIQTVLADHSKIRQLIANVREERTDANVKALINMLTLHDRRERTLLYPLSNVLFDDTLVNALRTEHNLMVLTTNDLRTISLKNATAQRKVDTMIEDVNAHLKEEEHELLPNISNFLNARPKLTAVMVRKWKQIKNTAPPLITELVDAEHITLKVLTAAFKLYSRQSFTNPANTAARKLRDKIACALVKHLREHAACEKAIFYPFIDHVMGAGITKSFQKDHIKLEAEFENLKGGNVSDRSYLKTMIKALKLELKHIHKERMLMPQLNTWLNSNFDASQDLTNSYVKCELENLK